MIGIGLMLLLLEIGSFVTGRFLVRKGWVAYVPDFTNEQMELYLRTFDPNLGWAFDTPTTWGIATDSAGRSLRSIPRPDPSPLTPNAPCASTYGDSFTYGTEASDSGAYPHFLGEALGCPVRNFGVPGFGSDQGVMLFRAHGPLDSAQVVIFGHLTENVMRNVNRYANLLYPGSPLRFKPRFLADADSVVLLPSPVRSKADFERVERDPEGTLKPDGLLDRPRLFFPHTAAVVNWLLRDIKVHARITQAPVERGFYAPDHPAGGLRLSAALLSAGVADARAGGKRAVALLLPSREALRFARREGIWIDQLLLDSLRARGTPVIHAGPEILAALGDADPCELFEGCRQTHMNARGNEIIATVVAKHFADMGLLPPADSAAQRGTPRASPP